ncbi:MAG: glycine cleavage system aminomethyltransferase GcvT [Alphaproteobacteria bacterium]|nr:glycine cleavage system aminomethyltransferase GcvT [Alphaproteobacteria bacterium]
MLLKTALHDNHLTLGAKMGAFAGYDMPLYYAEGVIREHEWTRSNCGLFDVSHMGQVTIEGKGAAEFLERITPSSFRDKKPGRAQYTVLTNEQGGIVDDLIITCLAEDKFFAVLNAGCKDKDIAWIKKHMPPSVSLYHMKTRALIAVQGPWAERVVHEIFDYDTAALPYMHLEHAQTHYGVPVYISRLGYTGEDGFEISLPNDEVPEIWEALVGYGQVKPVGLAARDSLRLEMGYPLYGHDIDETTSPVEADLGWVIGKNNTGFIGAERILKEKKDGPARKRVGLKLLDKGVAREGAEIRDEQDRKIGALTSGGFSPTLKESIGMGYVETGLAKPETKIFVNVRGRNIPAEIVKMPFVPARTKAMKKG